jgi:uncharacterized protein YacL
VSEQNKARKAPVRPHEADEAALSPRQQAGIRLVTGAVFGLAGAAAAVAFVPPLLKALSQWLAEAMSRQAVGTAGARPAPIELDPIAYVPIGLLGLVIGGLLGSLAAGWVIRVARAWERMAMGEKVDVFIGGFLGLIAASPILTFIDKLQAATPLIFFGIILFLASISIYMLRSMREVLPWHQKGRSVRHPGIKVLDTNILIDGRLLDLARAGFLEGDLYVAGFVLTELQHIADSSDSGKRQRGRRGLDVLKSLQSEFSVIVAEYDNAAGNVKEVDGALMALAKAIGGDLVTNDYNLNAIARASGVRVLNINDAAVALRLALMPGETVSVSLIREGSQFGQGVGYLEDGTMVVVEGGAESIGSTVEAEVAQVIQTERGKMVFAALDDAHVRTPRRR